MVPRDRPTIASGYKYNTGKVISFIDTEGSGITKAGIPSLSKYHFPFDNASIFPVDYPLIIYKFFGSVNKVDPHKNSGSQVWR